MSANDDAFYSALRSMLLVLQHPLLTDTLPLTAPHNVAAKILRHGLSVSAFALLERYVETKFVDLVKTAANCSVPYSAMLPEFQKFVTVDAISGLSNRMMFLKGIDRQQYVESNISLIASYNAASTSYTALGFSPKGSNVSDDDIRDAFSSCGIPAAWQRLSAITQAVGSARVSLSTDYRNLARSRHRSAHNPDGNVPTADLQTHIETAILVGLSVAVLTRAASAAFGKATTPLKLKGDLQAVTSTYRFIDEQANGTWGERASAGGKIVKIYESEAQAVAGAVGRKDSRPIICRDVRQVPIALY
jgi:hypothetical protein